jgi:histidinol dehydrogenase
MTEQNRNNFKGLIFSVIGGVIVGVVMFTISSFTSDKTEIKNDLIRLDKQKADISFVRECMVDVESRGNKSVDDLNKKLDDLTKKTDKILEIMITNR